MANRKERYHKFIYPSIWAVLINVALNKIYYKTGAYDNNEKNTAK
jgi:hypothetical protein